MLQMVVMLSMFNIGPTQGGNVLREANLVVKVKIREKELR